MTPNRFDQAAHSYEDFADVQKRTAAWLAEWIPHERAGNAWEIGAGTGLFTRHLIPWNGRLLATDASPNMVAAGRQHCPEAHWQVCDAACRQPERHDWIFTCSFLQWAAHPASLLPQWAEQLRPGGRILAGMFTHGAVPELHQSLGSAAPIAWRTDKDWRSLFGRAGLRVLACEACTEQKIYPTALDLFRSLHRIGATGKAALSASKLRKTIRRYEQQCPHRDGVKVEWHYCRILAAPDIRSALTSTTPSR